MIDWAAQLVTCGRWDFADFRSEHDLKADFDRLARRFIAGEPVPAASETS